ncbi:stage VI sporulation protein D [Lederbergia graminis]|uniref:Stage VI sporulation protein D n=1 Tax=Lederbergia graminis TaxID=735518 RepID=A0ABW0LLK0_9BACI
MPDRQQTSLRFPLEESVWFEKGQEVDELISLSLDPYITVLDEVEFIVLKGSLELSGEYRHAYSNSDVESFSVPGRTYMQTTEIRNDGNSEFSHHFPVDITIPRSRVTNLEDLEIEVESIDYDLLDGERLKLIADIYVHGVYSDNEIVEEEDVSAQVEEDSIASELELESVRSEVDEEEIVEVEVLEQQSQPEIIQQDSTSIESSYESSQQLMDEDEELFTPFRTEATVVPESVKKDNAEQENFKQHKVQSLPEIALHSIEEHDLAEVRNIESSSYVIDDYMEDESPQDAESSSDHQEPTNKVKKKKDKYKTMSFADFFARKEEEESAKLRVCLVQHGDSLEQIADKYDVSVQQILRENKLDANHEVYEGQVLYIPSKSVPILKKHY